MSAPQPQETRAYFGDAMQVSSFTMSSRRLGQWRWEAFVYARQPRGKPALVYRRRCLNETHARKVATDSAQRFNDHLTRTGKRWEERGTRTART